MEAAKKEPWWKRAWNVLTTIDSIQSIAGWLLGIGGGATGVAQINATSQFSQFTVEWWATVIAAFCFGAVATLLLWWLVLRVAPLVARWWRRAFSEPPYLRVTPLGGQECVLEIENDGGRCSVTAWARIVSVSHGFDYKRRDSYPVIWRMDWVHAYMQAPNGAVVRRGGPPLKMLVAGYEIVQAPRFNACGDSGDFRRPWESRCDSLQPKGRLADSDD